MPPTLILSARCTEDSQILYKAALANGWTAERPNGRHLTDALRSHFQASLNMTGRIHHALDAAVKMCYPDGVMSDVPVIGGQWWWREGN